MRFLIITQDLRVSGTSQGIIERSFLSKLRKSYPSAVIDVLYLCCHNQDDNLDILPVNSITKKVLTNKIPSYVKWFNRITRRFFNLLLAENYIHQQYAKEISKVDYALYNHIMVRSSGLEHETILSMYNLPILKHAIINFHDPYPYAWYKGSASRINTNELTRLKKMIRIVNDAKSCYSSAYYMSHDLQYLYASKKYFYTLPHQFDDTVFDLTDTYQMIRKAKKVTISYHGALMFGRNIENLLNAYKDLIDENKNFANHTELVLRLRGQGVKQLREKFASVVNIQLLDTLNFSNSSNEQIHESDIVLILENGPFYCNILVGKAPFLAAYHKPVLCLSPEKSELRNIIRDQRCIASMNDIVEIKQKLAFLIENRLVSNEPFYPFGDYFSDENFKKQLDEILQEK